MAQVSVTINGRVYRMACEDGQEERLHGLAERLDRTINQLRGHFGEIGDQRLTVMAAIISMDEMAEKDRRIAALEAQVEELSEARVALAGEVQATERDIARRIGEAAEKIEQLAASLTTVKPAG